MIGTDIQAATQQITAATVEIADTAKIPVYDTAHKSITWAQVKTWIASAMTSALASIFAPLAHAARHAAGGADAITTDANPTQNSTNPLQSGGAYLALSGKANLTNGIVAQSEARSKLIEKTASFTLADGDIEAILLCNSASAIAVTIPLDSACHFAAGTCFNFIRWGAGALSFTKNASANWVVYNSVTSVSATGGSATLINVAADVWWLVCS